MSILKFNEVRIIKKRALLTKAFLNIYHKEILRYAHEGEELFYSSAEDVKKYQKNKLQELLLYAYTHTKYYKEIFEEIELIKDNNILWQNYNKIPMLTKDILRERFDDLTSDDINKRKTYLNSSGGSTGTPVKFIQDKDYFVRNFADKILFGKLNGKNLGDLEIKLWGSERDILKGTLSIKDKIINFIYNRIFLNCIIMDEEIINKYIDIINMKKPVQIWAYYNSMYSFSKYIIDNDIQLHNPIGIICTGGNLYPSLRDTIKAAFPKSNVINQYGSREVGVIGCEVGDLEGIRVFDHSIYLEIFNKEKQEFIQEGTGNIIVTQLNNYSMPLIRYQIGDIAEISNNNTKSIGSFSNITSIKGRESFQFIKPDGTFVHGAYFVAFFYLKDWVKNFQIVQLDYNDVEIRIVLNAQEIPQEDKIKMLNHIKYVMGEECLVNIKIVDTIPKLKSGKQAYVYSEINQNMIMDKG